MIGLANANSLRMPLASGSVHCVVTSPPYYGLRKYAAGDEQLGSEELHDCLGWARGEPPCGRCFVCNLRSVFAEVWRVLRDDGTCWLNLGDSYASPTKGDNRTPEELQSSSTLGKGGRRSTANNQAYIRNKPVKLNLSTLQTGDLMGAPWRVALALQADGWVLRSDVIWAKRSAMPESVNGWRWERCRVKSESVFLDWRERAQERDAPVGTDTVLHQGGGHLGLQRHNEYTDCPGCATCEADGGYVLRRGSWRPTSAHEYIFQLVKGMGYYSDREAVKTPPQSSSLKRWKGQTGRINPSHQGLDVASVKGESTMGIPETGANLRDVWRLKQANYDGSHYAVFPPSLPETCIKASTSEAGCCPVCGSQWARVVEGQNDGDWRHSPYAAAVAKPNQRGGGYVPETQISKGFRATCEHGAAPVPATVLDPFVGSGTTVMVANALGRRGIGLDLSETYLRENARERTGLRALDTWKNGKPKQAESDLSGLPMFGEL